ncbi:BLUF domain-containing protein (plasmid) [Paracoccus liaowanqingii]|uniref:BLUF domain-containing protein n=1 Tax=Paracoccus liaowanqingii TaxID=2560053 RepID=A0A4Y5SS13_9RHOB|nr:BLUF domain-containing protein [Paracoccus liaowanqingii]QDA36267.1 BLUF domain-containing protein [Paracoccus liaowanqingii]
MQLTRLVYASNHGGIDIDTLREISEISTVNNSRDGITGFLVASEEDFMEFLEGSRTAIAQSFIRIVQDDRHRHIRVLLAGPIKNRICANWTMHSVELAQIDADIMTRYWVNGSFSPDELSAEELENLCFELCSTASDYPEISPFTTPKS